MNMAEPLISVIVPVYNPGKHLYKCLDTISSQTYKNLEIILIDDGSTDGSRDVCDEYADKDRRIIVVHQKNSGVSRARNNGIEQAHGDYYSFLDSDDYFETDMFEYVIDKMLKYNCDAVNFEHFGTYPDHEEVHRFKDESRYGLFDRAGAQRQLVTGVAFACNKLFSKKLVPEGVRFNEKIFRGEDSLFAITAFEKAERIWFDAKPLLHYVQSEESAVRGVFRKSQLSILNLCDEYEAFYTREYPELVNIVRSNMLELIIAVYYDAWADEEDFRKELLTLFARYKIIYSKIEKKKIVSAKVKFKICLFRYLTCIFCRIHKIIHRL